MTNPGDTPFLEIDVTGGRGVFELAVSVVLPGSGATALFGASGSGKTSLLRVLAGFDSAEGSIRCGGTVWLDSKALVNVPPHERGIGFMFQDARLFAHLDVAGNLQFAQRRARTEPQVVDYDAVVTAFDLGPLLQRRSAELSGGEAQRVALARTLLTQPRLLLLDEPLAALDEARKSELLPYLERLVRDFSIPLIYVSHDLEEVARLAPEMLVLESGAMVAQGKTADLFERLDLPDVSGRLEASALVEAKVVEQDTNWQLTRLWVAGQKLVVPRRAGLAEGDLVSLRVRARDVAIATSMPTGLSIRNVLSGTLVALDAATDSPFAEAVIELTPAAQGSEGNVVRLRSRITRSAAAELNLVVGLAVFALVKTVTFDR